MDSKLITLTNEDPRFYPLLGPYLASRAVAAHVGDKIWDDPGKTWIVLVQDGTVAGFIALRSARGAVTAESCYTAPDRDVTPRLVKAAVKAAHPSAMHAIVRHEQAHHYLAAGFTAVGETANFTKLARGARP